MHEIGLYGHCVRIIGLAAEHVGTAPDAELHYDHISLACALVSKVLPHIPPESGEPTDRLAKQLLHLAEWEYVPAYGLARIGTTVQAQSVSAAAVLVGSREGGGSDGVALSKVRRAVHLWRLSCCASGRPATEMCMG